MRKGKLITVLALFGLVIGILGTVHAAPLPPTNLTEGPSSSLNESAYASQSAEAEAGNVTQLDLEAVGSTNAWQGYYGNISGALVLENAAGNTFYNWRVSTPTGEVFASRSSSVTWASIACADAANVTTEESALSISASDADSISNTFSQSTHAQFTVGTTDFGTDTCSYATSPYTDTGQDNARFRNILLHDSANMVYTALIDAAQTGFNTDTWDFELLVGEDGDTAGTTTYYFYVELG